VGDESRDTRAQRSALRTELDGSQAPAAGWSTFLCGYHKLLHRPGRPRCRVLRVYMAGYGGIEGSVAGASRTNACLGQERRQCLDR
jgi:hypothetical protein